ncbi:hypothetical protein [Streptomyces sp. NPDC051211]|uniref:hypothetical protein n=1 Tax=Streptomyces sp. NPDC051211 TaxID=3154643 RepID=UPI00344EDE2D
MENEQPRRRRTGRTVALIAAAAVLGVLAGTVTGYAVQLDRAPTPLPPLAQQHLPAPKPVAADDATTPRPRTTSGGWRSAGGTRASTGSWRSG